MILKICIVCVVLAERHEKRCFEEENILEEAVKKGEIAAFQVVIILMISEYEIELLTTRFEIDVSYCFICPLVGVPQPV
jgi:hypothetical protein